jgi:hypothetical protein
MRRTGYDAGMTTTLDEPDDSPPPTDPEGDPTQKERDPAERLEDNPDADDPDESEGDLEAGVQPRS